MQLSSVLIPNNLRGFASDARAFDLTITGAKITAIEPSVVQQSSGTLIPCTVDLHTHIDKTFVVHETGAANGNLFTAIEQMGLHRATWTESALYERMAKALTQAYRSGARAMRTHIDWVSKDTPIALKVFERIRNEWRGKITLQCVSLVPLDLFDNAFDSEDIGLSVGVADQCCDRSLGEQVLLGAFVYRNERIYDKLQRVFDLALRNGVGIDFHVDEGLDNDARGLHAIAELTIKNNMQGFVTCGHACSLAVQAIAQANNTLQLCAKAGIHLVALPTTNLYLQGAWDRTPVERGITRICEAQMAGVNTSMATDNVADSFYPYGSYDLIDTFGLGIQVAHLHPADQWLSTITTNPANAMRLPWDGKIQVGCPADLIVLPANCAWDLLSPDSRNIAKRKVIRNGKLI